MKNNTFVVFHSMCKEKGLLSRGTVSCRDLRKA